MSQNAPQNLPEIVTLSNGIPVILQPYAGTAAATYWWIKTGSVDELPHEAGFAHFLEHMLFKDAAAKETGKASTGQMARAIESLGGDINAYTSFDQTVYHVTCASQHWPKVLDAFGQMAKPQRFLKTDFLREREVILEELAKNEDSPSRQLYQELFSQSFGTHPYGRPVIGFVKTLKAADVKTLEAFYQRQYVSANMGLILVGPIDAHRKEIFKTLEKRFGKKTIPEKKLVLKTTKAPAQKKTTAASAKRKPFVTKTFDVQTPTAVFSFQVPDIKHPSMPALDLATGVLGQGESSRLYQELFNKDAMVTDVSSGLFAPNQRGIVYFQVEAEDLAKLDAAVKRLFEVIRNLEREAPTSEEIDRIVNLTESERLYSTQTADSMAGRLGNLMYVLGDLNYDTTYLARLKSVTPEEIQSTAAQFFDYAKMSGVVLLPKGQKYDLPKLEALAKANFERKPAAVKALAPKAESGLNPQFIKRPSGLRVVYRPQPMSEVIAVHASVLGGSRLELTEGASHWGTSHLLAMTWSKGTSQKTSRQIASIVEGRAAGLDGFSGRNTIGLSFSGLKRDWKELNTLFSEVLIEPSFPEIEVEHSRRVALDSVRSIDDHSSQLCSKLFLETLFEKHPYGKLTLGSEQTLSAITPEQIRSLHRKWISPQELVISISGALKEADLEAFISQIERGLKSASGQKRPTIMSESELAAPRWVERKLGREQVHLLVGGLGTTMNSDDRIALELLENILGGQSGRLFIELREKKSLAYTVSPVHFEGLEKGYIATYIASGPTKRDEAVNGIRKVHEDLVKKGVKMPELKRAQEYLLGRRAMDLQSDPSVAAYLGLEHLYGLEFESESALEKKIRAVNSREIQDLCEQYYLKSNHVTATVG